MQTISSQRHLNASVVDTKRTVQDYTVTVSPWFEVEGEEYRVVLDGHHSLAAAKADGVEPSWVTATATTDDRILLLPDFEAFLAACRMDSDYYDVFTGLEVW